MYKVSVADKSFELKTNDKSIVFEDLSKLQVEKVDRYTYRISNNGELHELYIMKNDPDSHSMVIRLNGTKYNVQVKDKYEALLEKLGMKIQTGGELNEIKAPMPGLIVQIVIDEGQEVSKGDKLLVLEAMKMENIIKSPGDGTVKKIHVKNGDSVEKKQVLVEF